jgi:hypothetical protein
MPTRVNNICKGIETGDYCLNILGWLEIELERVSEII